MINTELLAEKFPHARFHDNQRLLTWFPTGALTNERADQIVDFLELQEPFTKTPFNRFTDMTGYTRIQIGLDHVVRIARRRRHSYKGQPVKSAFFAQRLISISIARMYEELMDGSNIHVRTFRDRKAVAEWLEVPFEILQRPKD
jgi:hypothetical protein